MTAVFFDMERHEVLTGCLDNAAHTLNGKKLTFTQLLVNMVEDLQHHR